MEKVGDLTVSAQLKRFHASVQPPLLFVEDAGEQDNRRPKLIGRSGGWFQQSLPRPKLLLPRARVHGTVQIQARNGLTTDAVLFDQAQERFLNRHLKNF